MGESLTQFLPSSLSFLSIGFSILIILPRLQKLIKKELDLELKRKIVSTLEFLSIMYYLKVVRFLDVLASLFILGSLLVLLVPLGLLSPYFVIVYEISIIALTISRLIYAAIWSVHEALSYSKISPSIAKRLLSS